MARGRIKTCFIILGLAQILVYVSTFSTMLLGGHCEPDVATIPYAMTIMMGLQLLVFLYLLFEHCFKGYGNGVQGLEEFETKTDRQDSDKVMFE